MSPGEDTDPSVDCVAVNSSVDNERLCSLDVLDLAHQHQGDQSVVYEEFCGQLTRDTVEGWYETSLRGKEATLPSLVIIPVVFAA